MQALKQAEIDQQDKMLQHVEYFRVYLLVLLQKAERLVKQESKEEANQMKKSGETVF
jgi:hypothetical protein